MVFVWVLMASCCDSVVNGIDWVFFLGCLSAFIGTPFGLYGNDESSSEMVQGARVFCFYMLSRCNQRFFFFFQRNFVVTS